MPIEGFIGGGSLHPQVTVGSSVGNQISRTYSVEYYERQSRTLNARRHLLLFDVDLNIGFDKQRIASIDGEVWEKIETACLDLLGPEHLPWYRRDRYSINKDYGFVEFLNKTDAVAVRLAIDL